MMATIECGVCGRRLLVDTCEPCNPEELGWREMPLYQASFAACMNGITEVLPVCPDCQDSHARIAEMFDPFSETRTAAKMMRDFLKKEE